MSELLEHPSPEPAPHRSPRRVSKGVAVLAVAVVLLVLAAGAVYAVGRLQSHFASAPDYSGSGTGEVVVQVKQGDTAVAVARTLAAADVVKSAEAFRSRAANDPSSVSLQPGYYRLHRQMSAKAALALLLDPASRLRGRVTVPEGTPLSESLPLIAKATSIPLAQLEAAAKNPAGLGLPDYANGRLEGFLYPATYDIEPGTTAVQVLTLMVTRFKQAAAEIGLEEGAQALGISPYEALTVASLTEKEAGVAADFPKVSRVVFNRLQAGMPLQFDSTVNYVRKQRTARLSLADISVDSPYNSYKRTGLPPTPIDSPGQVALEAALHPAEGDWIYFITIDKQGNSLFTKSYAEFLRAKGKAQREGVY